MRGTQELEMAKQEHCTAGRGVPAAGVWSTGAHSPTTDRARAWSGAGGHAQSTRRLIFTAKGGSASLRAMLQLATEIDAAPRDKLGWG
jgi:hypothetical protein